jgi:hypothetical protein
MNRMGAVTTRTTWLVFLFSTSHRRRLTASQWDLGEFMHKGEIRTRWGTRDELLSACRTAREHGIDVLIDAVLNVCGVLYVIFLFLQLLSTNLVLIDSKLSQRYRQTQLIG